MSVLLPVYGLDEPDYVQCAFNSLLRQTVAPDEIIMVIDGPVPDQLQEVLGQIQSRTDGDIVKIVWLASNVGLGEALNAGMLHCSSEYIARMDSDDISIDTRLEIQREFLNANPGVGMVGASFEEFNEQMEVSFGIRQLPVSGPDLEAFARWRTPINHPTIMFRRELIDQTVRYPLGRAPFEDWWFAMQFLKAGYCIYNLPEVLLLVRGGREFTSRRAGLSYGLTEVRFLNKMLSAGLMSYPVFVLNVMARLPMRLLPQPLLKLFYRFILRS